MLPLLLSLALAQDALPEVPPPRPRARWGEVMPTPKTALAMGVGLGIVELSARVRQGFVSLEPRVAVGVALNPSGISGPVPSPPTSNVVADVAAGLDVRGFPVIDRRWEVGALVGLGWGAALGHTTFEDDPATTLHRHRLFLRVGAGFAWRPAPWNSVGLDLTAEPLVATVTPFLGADDEAAWDSFRPSVVASPRVGFSVRWILWFGARDAVARPEGA